MTADLFGDGDQRMLDRFRIPEIILGALFSSLLWAGIWAWTDSYAPTESQKQECYETAKKAGNKTEDCKTLWEKTTTDPVAFFTFVLSLSTVGLWLATIGLYFAGEKQIAISTKAADAAKEAADAAKKSAEVAELSLHTAETSYIVLDHFMITMLEIGKIPIFNYRAKNLGKTEGEITEIKVNYTISDRLPTIPDYNVTSGPSWRIPPAGGSFPGIKAFNGPLTKQDFDSMKGEAKKIFVWVKLVYADVFGNIFTRGFAVSYEANNTITTFTPQGPMTQKGVFQFDGTEAYNFYSKQKAKCD